MEIVIRVTVIYLVLLVGLRIIGKREFSQLSSLELVTLLIIPEIVSQSLVHLTSLMTAIIGVATLLSLVFLHSIITHLSKRAEKVVTGSPKVLVEHGKFVENTMNLERISPGEVYGVMHENGIEHLGDVRWAILECDGSMSIIQEEQNAG